MSSINVRSTKAGNYFVEVDLNGKLFVLTETKIVPREKNPKNIILFSNVENAMKAVEIVKNHFEKPM